MLGFGIAVSSLTWQVYTFLMQGARPKLSPVVGYHSGGGLVANDNATRDVRESLRSAVEQLPPGELIVGVKVINAGRAPFHVARWPIRADPSGTTFVPVDNPIGCPEVPCDIPPGAERIFFTGLANARVLAAASGAIDSRHQRVVATGRAVAGRTCLSRLLR